MEKIDVPCRQCKQVKSYLPLKVNRRSLWFDIGGVKHNLCSTDCFNAWRTQNQEEWEKLRVKKAEESGMKFRPCLVCGKSFYTDKRERMHPKCRVNIREVYKRWV